MIDRISRLGIGVMIRMLSGNEETYNAWQKAKEQIIKKVELTKVDLQYNDGVDALVITFDDGSKFRLFDKGQSCCESRYMRTDDDLGYHIGAQLLNVEVRESTETSESEYGDIHEVAFLTITTSKGTISCSSHNEHNGYYGGFSIEADWSAS